MTNHFMPYSVKIVVLIINSAETDGIIYLCMLHHKKTFALIIRCALNPTSQFRISGGKNFFLLSVFYSKLVFSAIQEKMEEE